MIRRLAVSALALWTLGAGTTFAANDTLARSRRGPARDAVTLDGLAADGEAQIGSRGMHFNGGWITMGLVPELGATTFTLETWFRYDGPGDFAYTGWVGFSAYPLITRGRHESGPTGTDHDMNYFLGIDHDHDGQLVLVADFEDDRNGANNPVIGGTPVDDGLWHHAAATYDGTTWHLYLDGTLDATSRREATPRADSVQHFALGTAMNSNGVRDGAFNGALDDVRVWDHARTAESIRASLNEPIEPTEGLLGAWRLNDTLPGVVVDASNHGHHGIPVSVTTIDGAPFDIDVSPNQPVRLDASDSEAPGTLRVNVSDPEHRNLNVTFRGRAVSPPRDGAYRIVVLPDTQVYIHKPEYLDRFEAQVDWIVENKQALNIVYVAHVGDIVHVPEWQWQWDVASEVLAPLDALNVPYGFAIGNHDEDEPGQPETATFFNEYFPVSRYDGVAPWYGGHFGETNNNSFVLFSAGGDDFIAIHTDYAPGLDVQSWIQDTLTTHADRRAIIVGHNVLGNGEQARFTNLGSPLYEAVKSHSNVFMMLCGHVYGEGKRVDIHNGNTIDTLMANYQGRRHGGNGLLRIIELAPGDDEFRISTYSPYHDRWETDNNSQFSLHRSTLDGRFRRLHSIENVPSGSTVAFDWQTLAGGRTYEWNVVVDDGTTEIESKTWSFDVAPVESDVNGDGSTGLDDLIAMVLGWGVCAESPCAGDLNGDGQVGVDDLVLLLMNWD